MELYYHRTDGGAEYYSTTYIEGKNGHREGTFDGVVMRTDGNEIEIFQNSLQEQGIRLRLTRPAPMRRRYTMN